MTTLRSLEQAERCLSRIDDLRQRGRRHDMARLLLFCHACEQAEVAGYSRLAEQIKSARWSPGQPELNLLLYYVRALLRERVTTGSVTR